MIGGGEVESLVMCLDGLDSYVYVHQLDRLGGVC